MTHDWSWNRARESSITLVDGLRVGHSTNLVDATGCTAIICDIDPIAGVDVRGGATASHEIELLNPTGLVDRIQGIMLTGGSAMGLGAVQGGVEYFRTLNRGFTTEQSTIPIMPAAAIYDLGIGNPSAFPTHADGLVACQSASVDFQRGNVGAGTGAVVGKIQGHAHATQGGLGSAGWHTNDGLKVGALAVVNAFGDVHDPNTASIIAGARTDQSTPLNTATTLITGNPNHPPIKFGSNTTLCVIATNAKLTKAQASIVARIAQTGISRTVSPCHTQYDGDMVFALSLGDQEYDLNRIGVLASRLIEAAIVDAILQATSIHNIPSANDLGWFKSLNSGQTK